MKKIIIGVLATAALVAAPVFADVSATSTSQIQAMLTQIQNLQAQLAALTAAQNQVSQTLSLIRTLRQGMSGSDVTTLQTILASDPSIFPDGSITGFFGPKTAAAVRKFQSKHGLDAVGFVGPKTLQKLNEEIGNLGLSDDHMFGTSTVGMSSTTPRGDDRDDHDGHGPKLCIPPGHLIAPGWMKKHGEGDDHEDSLVPLCSGMVPPGIGMKMGDGDDHHGTTTPDTTAPIISNLVATPMATSTTVAWMTNEPATSKVWFGAGASSTPVVVPGLVTNHVVMLSGLATSTQYSYFVVTSDMFGNTATSSTGMFTTLAQ